MDEKSSSYRMKAPGASGSAPALRLPGRAGRPQVDDHLDEPEVTRRERLDGRVLEASPAQAPHAIHHSQLDYVIRGKVAPGHVAASDLKTRFAEASDFASDTAVLKDGIDPETGTRYLEELAFEVVSEQNVGNVSKKAARMIARGVRRVFAVFVKQGRVSEWSAESEGWMELEPAAVISDPGLIEPLEVAALLDAAAADDAVASGLVRRNNPVIAELRERSRTEGRAEGRAEGRTEGRAEGRTEGRAEGRAEGLRLAVTEVCELLGLELTPERRSALADSGAAELEAILGRLKRTRRWD